MNTNVLTTRRGRTHRSDSTRALTRLVDGEPGGQPRTHLGPPSAQPLGAESVVALRAQPRSRSPRSRRVLPVNRRTLPARVGAVLWQGLVPAVVW